MGWEGCCPHWPQITGSQPGQQNGEAAAGQSESRLCQTLPGHPQLGLPEDSESLWLLHSHWGPGASLSHGSRTGQQLSVRLIQTLICFKKRQGAQASWGKKVAHVGRGAESLSRGSGLPRPRKISSLQALRGTRVSVEGSVGAQVKQCLTVLPKLCVRKGNHKQNPRKLKTTKWRQEKKTSKNQWAQLGGKEF